MLHPNSTVSAIYKSVLVAEVISKIRSTFNTMSYGDIINVVISTASRISDDKIEGQKEHDSIKNVSNNFKNNPKHQISTNSHQLSLYGEIKSMQCNCRGLSNKLSEILEFSKKKDFDIVCFNEIRSWHNENLTDE